MRTHFFFSARDGKGGGMIYAVQSEQFASFLTWACQNQRLAVDHGYHDHAALHEHG